MSRPSWTHSTSKWDPNDIPLHNQSVEKRGRPSTVYSSPGVAFPEEKIKAPGVADLGEASSSHPDRARSEPRKSRSRRRRKSHRERSDVKPFELGRTVGVFAAGAWAARAEVAELLEKGYSGRDLLRAIRGGQEGEVPLRTYPVPGTTTSPPRKRRSEDRSPRRSPETRSINTGEGIRESVYATPLGLKPIPPPPSVLASTSFRKKAVPPPEGAKDPNDGPQEEHNEGVDSSLDSVEKDPNKSAEEVTKVKFNKKATPPPRGIEELLAESKTRRPPVTRVPVRKDPRTIDKYAKYDELTRELFDELVVRRVMMDLVDLVYLHSEPSMVDESKFQVYTDPRSPDTGLRYGRLLRRFLAWLGDEAEGERVFSNECIGGFIQELIKSASGLRTPQAFLYSLEFFSVIFGFQVEKSGFRRWRKMADDYSRTAPPSKPAPFLGVPFMEYLEGVVVAEERPLFERVTAGKMRLCIQASIRHSDLTRTPLRDVQWCRESGSEKCLGIRAKAPITKTGPRPWVACHLGTSPQHDSWLVALMNLMLQTHGSGWKTHEFFGCSPLGDEGFSDYPSSLSSDVEIIRRMLLNDLEKGLAVPLTKEAALEFRWHSAKNCMATLMSHLGIQPRIIRHQGAWKKASDTMIDLYLREGQTMVLKAQIKVMDLVRKGVKISTLEGVPIDAYPGQVSLSPTHDDGWEIVEDRGKNIPVDVLERAMASVSVVDHADRESVKVNYEMCYDLKDLQPEFQTDEGGEMPQDRDPPQDYKDLFAENDSAPETSEDGEDSGRGSADEGYEATERDVDCFPSFVVLGSGSGKIHKPATLKAGDTNPACCVQGRHFASLTLDEAWGDSYSLCARCFGRKGGCSKLCKYQTSIKGELHQCGRRCSGTCDTESEGHEVSHFCSFHAPVD